MSRICRGHRAVMALTAATASTLWTALQANAHIIAPQYSVFDNGALHTVLTLQQVVPLLALGAAFGTLPQKTALVCGTVFLTALTAAALWNNVSGQSLAAYSTPLAFLAGGAALISRQSKLSVWLSGLGSMIVGVHLGGLGWNGFLTFGILYWMVPRMWATKLFSTKLANLHFWLGTLGIIFYALPMYVSGVVQSLMWKEFSPEGFLVYKNFLETTVQILPLHMLRAVGGALYLTGAIIMTYNLIKTAYQGTFIADEEATAAPLPQEYAATSGGWHHRVLEHKPILFTVLAVVAILIGGIIELVPTFLIKSNVPTIASVKPYTPLELHGRDIYIREGCVNCHTQMVRPFRSETERYGEYSKAGEFVYDHPFLWGSKRTGPDLHRTSGKYSNAWHFNHMLAPDAVSTGSIMPPYPWLFEQTIDKELTRGKIKALRTIGVPYELDYENMANDDLEKQAAEITANLKTDGIEVAPDAEIIALISYLQRLGKDIKVEKLTEKQN